MNHDKKLMISGVLSYFHSSTEKSLVFKFNFLKQYKIKRQVLLTLAAQLKFIPSKIAIMQTFLSQIL